MRLQILAESAINAAAIDPAAIDPAAIDPAAIDATAIDPTAIDPTAIDLTPLVNALIHSSQSGSRQLFSLLSVSSFSPLDLHKLTLLVYNISSVKSLDSGLFRRRFCYCVTNDTNDLSDFTAILLDVMGNSTSYLQELFRSSSILSVSQRNDSDCIYICVMAGKTGREVSGFWDDGSVTPLFNQTIVEGPNRVANISSIRLPVASPHLSRTSSTTLKVTTSVGVTPTPSRPPGFTTGRPSTETPNIRTSQSISTPQIRTSAGTVRRPTSAAAPAPSVVTARPPADAAAGAGAATAPSVVTPRPPADAAAGASTAPSAVTARPPAAAATAPAAAGAATAPSVVTPRPPADAAAGASTAPSAVTARPPADADAGAATAPAAAGAVTAPSAVTPRPPADTTFLKSPDSLMETNISPTSLQTTFIRPSTLRPTGRPAETKPSSKDATPDRSRETERPEAVPGGGRSPAARRRRSANSSCSPASCSSAGSSPSASAGR
ncbi:HERV-H LTR-associating protein 1 [Xiphophorus maculatus]|uniref:HERV-H LTR-associating protein 1 n=1 Tax=Xiphophorus maculatus TaxID=8083 RepID=UPI000C6D317D|nr:HERV-H LTR-associating protein 1 [Xiphophorus maculatus]